MSDEPVPSAKLAALTVDRLIQSGLLRAERRDALIAKVASGDMKGLDWKNQIDFAVEKATQA
jgi:hypothetical protein